MVTKLANKTTFIHLILDNAHDLEALIARLGSNLDLDHSVWLCTDAAGREGFQLWNAEESLAYEAGPHVAQFGVSELAKHGVSDRFNELREALDIELKGFPVGGYGSGSYANVEFLKSMDWFW